MTAEAVVRFALAIAFDALAFTIWDIGTRPPTRLAHDVASGLRRPSVLARGVARFVAGAALLVFGFVVAWPEIPSTRAFTVIETGMLIAALIVENLIGPDLRRRIRRPA